MRIYPLFKRTIYGIIILCFSANAYCAASFQPVVEILEKGQFDKINMNPFVKEFHNEFLKSYYQYCPRFIKNPKGIVITQYKITTDEFGNESKNQKGSPTTIYVDSRYADTFRKYFNESFTPSDVWAQIKRMQDNNIRNEIAREIAEYKDNQKYMASYLSNNCTASNVFIALENLYRLTHSLPAFVDLSDSKESGKLLHNLIGHNDKISGVGYSPNGEYIVSGSFGHDDNLKIWNVATGDLIRSINSQTSWMTNFSFAPDGQYFVGGGSGYACGIWNKSGTFIGSYYGSDNARCKAGLFSLSKGHMFTRNNNAEITLWRFIQKEKTWSVKAYKKAVYDFRLSADGRVLITTGEDDKGILSVKKWNVSTGKLISVIANIHTEFSRFTCMSRNGKYLTTIEFDKSGVSDKTNRDKSKLIILDLDSNKIFKSIKMEDLKNGADVFPSINKVEFSPDPNIIAIPFSNGDIKLWNMLKGQFIEVYAGHTKPIIALAFSKDGQGMVSGGAGKMVNIWDLATTFAGKRESNHQTTDVLHAKACQPGLKKLCNPTPASQHEVANKPLTGTHEVEPDKNDIKHTQQKMEFFDKRAEERKAKQKYAQEWKKARAKEKVEQKAIRDDQRIKHGHKTEARKITEKSNAEYNAEIQFLVKKRAEKLRILRLEYRQSMLKTKSRDARKAAGLSYAESRKEVEVEYQKAKANLLKERNNGM